MARRVRSDDVWDDAWDKDHGDEDHDNSDGDDLDGDDLDGDDTTLPCPYCQRPIYADAPRCPYCENYLSDEEAAPPRKPWWIAIVVGLCLYLVYRWTVGR